MAEIGYGARPRDGRPADRVGCDDSCGRAGRADPKRPARALQHPKPISFGEADVEAQSLEVVARGAPLLGERSHVGDGDDGHDGGDDRHEEQHEWPRSASVVLERDDTEDHADTAPTIAAAASSRRTPSPGRCRRPDATTRLRTFWRKREQSPAEAGIARLQLAPRARVGVAAGRARAPPTAHRHRRARRRRSPPRTSCDRSRRPAAHPRPRVRGSSR